jgi:hypothetical protein
VSGSKELLLPQVPDKVTLSNILVALLTFKKIVLFPTKVPLEIEPPSIAIIQFSGISTSYPPKLKLYLIIYFAFG